MKIGPFDLGATSNPWLKPLGGIVRGEETVEGGDQIAWSRAGKYQEIECELWVKCWQAVGGSAAGSLQAARYFMKQLEELRTNVDLNPTFIQWTATADPAGSPLNNVDPHDGWYQIDDFNPDYETFLPSGYVKVAMHATGIAAAPPRTVKLFFAGGALPSSYSGTAKNLLSFPVGSVPGEATFNRSAAEGLIPCVYGPAALKEPFWLSSTIAQWFEGGVHVYDTINTGTNPVPTTGGTFVNTSWVEVFHPTHDFVGDCVITNGLQLLLFQAGTNQLCSCYVWNTAAAQANWLLYGTLQYADSAGNAGTLRSYSPKRVGMEECSVVVSALSSGGKTSDFIVRLQRGRYEGRVDFWPQVESNTNVNGLQLVSANNLKIVYNSGAVSDSSGGSVVAGTMTVAADFGYAAGFENNTAVPIILGLLWQNPPASAQPAMNSTAVDVGIGDNALPMVNTLRSYGFYAIPFGVSGTFSTANLQGECESGTLGTGWSSVADGTASGGNTAELASGTASGNNDTISASWTPPAGMYILAARYRNSGAPTNATEVQVGALIGGTFTNELSIGSGTGSVAAYTFLTSAPFALNGSQTFRFQIKSGGSATTVNHFFDEIVLLPVQLTADNRGPQDLFQQFLFDRSSLWQAA